MVNVILSHEVKDFATWKQGFDGDSDNREKAGFNVTGVFQSTTNPNEVTVTSEFGSEEKIHEFLANPRLKEAMANAGVIGQPQIKILSRVN